MISSPGWCSRYVMWDDGPQFFLKPGDHADLDAFGLIQMLQSWMQVMSFASPSGPANYVDLLVL